MRQNPDYHAFISYTKEDVDIAASIASRLNEFGLHCFMVDRSILAGARWDSTLREAICASERIIALITPRSKQSLWVAAEAGAAWVLQKELIPITMFVEPGELFGPLQSFQVRSVETSYQIDALCEELARLSGKNPSQKGSRRAEANVLHHEIFTAAAHWRNLIKVGEWDYDVMNRKFDGEGMYRYLLSADEYGKSYFNINAHIQFSDLKPLNKIEAVNAGIVLGWRSNKISRQDKQKSAVSYYNLLLTGERLLLEMVGKYGGDEYADFEHIDEGVPFLIRENFIYRLSINLSNKASVHLDNRLIYECPLPKPPVGRVGLRPWRSHLHCTHFEVKSEA